MENGYRYARRFTLDFLGCPDDMFQDDPMEYSSGDIFLALDLTHQITIVHEKYLTDMSRVGVRIIFMVYDLLPIQFPQYWEPHHAIHSLHQQWLKVITKFDCAVCISKAVADELTFWVKENGFTAPATFRNQMVSPLCRSSKT